MNQNMEKDICIFIAPLPPPVHGQSAASELFYKYLIKNNYDVILINTNKHELKSGFFGLNRFFSVVRMYFDLFISIRRIKRIDLVYLSLSESTLGNLKDLFAFIILFRFLDKTNLHLHGGAGLRELFKRNPFFFYFNRFFYRRVQTIIVLGPSLEDIFSSFDISEKIKVVYNFADDKLLLDKDLVKEKFLEKEKLIILFCSNIILSKGYLDLISAVDELDCDDRSKIKLIFAGKISTDKDRLAIDEAISKHPSVISYIGFVNGDDKVSLFKEAQIFCLPTYYPFEGQPISILEAYASGCVVMTTNHSGIIDVFSDRWNGFQVDKKSPTSIAKTIALILKDRHQLVDIACNNIKEYESKYLPEKHLESMRDKLNLNSN